MSQAWALGLSLLLVTPAPAAVAPGVYDGSQTEMAVRLVLRPDGRFAYALSYGALDEQAQGRWVEADGKLLLTTEPKPKPPRFAVVSDKPAADGSIHVALSDPDLLQGSSLTMAVTYEGASAPAFVEVDEDGRLPVPPGKTVAALVPDLPVFEQPLPAYALTPGGHSIVFRFEPNDLGIAALDKEPLGIDGDVLVMQRHGRTILFRKSGG